MSFRHDLKCMQYISKDVIICFSGLEVLLNLCHSNQTLYRYRYIMNVLILLDDEYL